MRLAEKRPDLEGGKGKGDQGEKEKKDKNGCKDVSRETLAGPSRRRRRS